MKTEYNTIKLEKNTTESENDIIELENDPTESEIDLIKSKENYNLLQNVCIKQCLYCNFSIDIDKITDWIYSIF
jgi:2-iminoacetate synthase ThiH